MAVGDVHFHNKFLATMNVPTLASGTVRCYLLNGWTPNIDTDHYLSDIVANEIALSGYTAGGYTLQGKTVTEDDTNDRAAWDFDNPTWASIASGGISRAALIMWTGNASTSVVICNIEVSNSNGQSYTITIPSGGILLIRQAA